MMQRFAGVCGNGSILWDNLLSGSVDKILKAILRATYRNGTLMSAVYRRSMRWAGKGEWAKCTLDPLSGRT